MKESTAHNNAQFDVGRRGLGKKLGLRAGDALIVVDLQRDFLPGGSLPVAFGDTVLDPVNAYLSAFEAQGLPIFLTRDWHPLQHCSFRNQGGRWPPHCVQGTSGADWPDELCVPAEARIISKATEPLREAYSAFDGTQLARRLTELHVDRVFVAGLATNYCVLQTVLDARQHGLAVVVLDDAVRGIDVRVEDSTNALYEMVKSGATLFRRAHHVGHALG